MTPTEYLILPLGLYCTYKYGIYNKTNTIILNLTVTYYYYFILPQAWSVYHTMYTVKKSKTI